MNYPVTVKHICRCNPSFVCYLELLGRESNCKYYLKHFFSLYYRVRIGIFTVCITIHSFVKENYSKYLLKPDAA